MYPDHTIRREFIQPLDHFAKPNSSSSTLTLPQIYYVDSQYYKASGPVVLYSVGERAALESDLRSGWISDLARLTNGLLVLLEQRFYGASVPSTASLAQDPGPLRYLTVEQMMADIRRFIQESGIPELQQHRHRSKRGLPGQQANNPWVLVGGSFVGSLMAWTKHQYPDLDVAVVASSAPMVVKDGYWEFDKMVASRLPCAEALSSAVREVDTVLGTQNDTQIEELKRAFGLESMASTGDF
ncbi:hypothetical protein GQ54DRAFT_261333, partial [Martensiomyces pterosporus]